MVHPLLKQIYASTGSICLYLSNGFTLSLLSLIVTSLRTTDVKLTLEQESWIPSILILMMCISQCITGLLTTLYGRKMLMIASLIPAVTTYVILYFSQNFTSVFLAFFISGFVGGGIAIGPMLIAEMSSPKYRGVLLNVRLGAYFLGATLVHLLGNFLDWRTFVLGGTIPGIIGLITSITTPESPAWLAYKGRYEESKTAFAWFRGVGEKKELRELKKYENTEKMFTNLESKTIFSRVRCVVKYLFNKAFLKAASINLSISICVECSGKQMFLTYLYDILFEMVEKKEHIYLYALSMDIVDFVALVISCIVISKFKRRQVLFGFGIPAIAIIIISCLVAFLISRNILPRSYSWVTILFFSLFFLLINIGVLPTCLTIASEVYPLSHRGVGVAFTSFSFGIITFTLTKATPYLMRSFGVHGTYLINATITGLSLLHLYFFVPETDNKTLQEIEEDIKSTVITNTINPKEETAMLPHPLDSDV